MEPELRAHLFACAEAYASAKGLELVTVARLAAGDWRFFDRLDNGKTFTARKYDDVLRWFSASWPDGLAWPAHVVRPEARSSKAALLRKAAA